MSRLSKSLLALVLLLLIGGCAGGESGPTATVRVPLAATATAVALATQIPEPVVTFEGRLDGATTPEPPVQEVAETEHFVFRAEDGFPREHAEFLSGEAEELLEYVSGRLEGSLDEQITVTVRQRAEIACPARGIFMRMAGEPQIVVFSTESSDMDELRGILAHEIAHAFSSATHLVHLEALATWGAGAYWAAWKDAASVHDVVRSYIAAGDYLPLHENEELLSVMPEQASEDCLRHRDILYTEWASFLGYLMESYGEEKLQALTLPPARQVNENEVVLEPPDYEGVYGMSLEELEEEWLAMLDGELSSE
jgi:hypothetical protein